MTPSGGRRRERIAGIARAASVLVLALLLPGCIDLPEESKALLEVFIVVLAISQHWITI